MKLTKEMRQERKTLKAAFGKNLILASIGRITFAFIKTGQGRGKFAWSIHSKNDGKFHRKYGEFMALQRLFYNEGMPIEFYHLEDIESIFWDLANSLILDL